MEEVAVVGVVKRITEETHKEVTNLNEFITEISETIVTNFGEVNSKLNSISNNVNILMSNKDAILQTRTSVSAMSALLQENMVINIICKILI